MCIRDRYQTNSKGEIASVRVLFKASEKETEKTETPAENLAVVYGKVVKKFASSMNVTVNDGDVMNMQLPDDVVVYSVDTTKTKNNIEVATTGDIQAYDEDEGNRVFVSCLLYTSKQLSRQTSEAVVFFEDSRLYAFLRKIYWSYMFVTFIFCTK